MFQQFMVHNRITVPAGARHFIFAQTLRNACNALATLWQAVPGWKEGVGKTQGP